MTNKTFNFGVDLDGVMCNFAKTFSTIANSLYGERCPIIKNDAEILGWDWWEWYPITKMETDKCWYLITNTKNFWLTLPIHDKKGLENFKKYLMPLHNANIYFITARRSTAGMSVVKQSIQWLSNNGIINPQVIEIYDKGPALNALNIQYFIDDKSENIISALKDSDSLVYVMDAGHNKLLDKKLNKNPRYDRVKNLTEFVKKVIKNMKEKGL